MTPNIVNLDARAVQASVAVVSRAADASVLDQIVAMLGRRPTWPELP